MSKLKQETYKAGGMACTGCEAVIEETLKKLDGVVDVKADFSQKKVTVAFDPSRVDFEKMASVVRDSGYTLEAGVTDAAIAANGRATAREAKAFTPLQFIGIVVVLIALYLIISTTVGFNFIPEVKSSMGYGVLFLVGLLTSLHCVAMCGGINMSQCVSSGAVSGAVSGGARAKIKPSLLYNLGRVTSYTLIGGIVGAIGSAISFAGWARGIVAVISGLFMVIMGLSMTGLFPWIHKITPRLPRVFREKAGKAGKGRGPYIVGLLNGLMPCGPLQAMQLYALGTGSLLAGALSMFFFSLGTVPLMFGLGAVVTLLGSKFTKNMMKVSAVLVAVLGVIMLGRGLGLSGVQMPSFGVQPVLAAGQQETSETSVVNGVQNITSTLTSGTYPAITVQKDIPVVWTIKADEENINGCNKTLIIPKYNIQVDLKPGDNIIKFTPTDSGTIPYSCWMGMIRSQITVVDSQSSATSPTASDPTSSIAPVRPSGSCCSITG